MTIPIIGHECELSIFLQANLDEIIEQSNEWTPAGVVEPVVHGWSERGEGGSLDSHMSEHCIVVDAIEADEVPDAAGVIVPKSCHKLGGMPYVYRRERIDGDVQRALDAGFRQVIQLDFPNNTLDSKTISGDWPFADGLFHLLMRSDEREREWAWFWQTG
jgi:hypothetical protein